jgi:anti-sigma regulatory factor (Ser/Thr protein kinase)
MTCTKELILNAHRHGHKYDETKKIIIRYRDNGANLSLIIEDEGPGFDHRGLLASIRQKDAATSARERYLAGGFGGLGFQLITKLARELSYNESGNICTFSVDKN